MLLHLKDEVDAPLGGEAESLTRAIASATKVVDAVELAYTSGDLKLGRSTPTSLRQCC